MVCKLVDRLPQSGVMTIHSGVTTDHDPVSSGVGMVQPENPVHASLARIAEEFADNTDSQSPPVTMRWSPTLMRLFGLRRLPKHVLLQRWPCLVGQARRAESVKPCLILIELKISKVYALS